MLSDIRPHVLSWANEVGVLLDACRQLVEYYGTDDEFDSFRKSVEAPIWLVGALQRIAEGEEVDTTRGPAFSGFICGEELASMLTPLLRIVVEWEPEFLADARATLDPDSQKRIIVPYGQFLGTTGRYVCGPIWSKFPVLAPQGWTS